MVFRACRPGKLSKGCASPATNYALSRTKYC